MNMQTGFGDAGDRMAEQYIDTMTNLLLPVLEQSTLLAAEYSKACGRDTLLPEDMEYAMKYCAMYTVGQATGSMFPEIYQEDDDEEYESDDQKTAHNLNGIRGVIRYLLVSMRHMIIGMSGCLKTRQKSC